MKLFKLFLPAVVGLAFSFAYADEVITDDLIVIGSGCIGLDCDLDEEFALSSLLLKENNLRIFFNDTSNTGAYPNNDWELIANDSANEGKSYFGIADRLPGWPTVSGGGICIDGNHADTQCTGDTDCAGICNGGGLDGQPCNLDVSFCSDHGGVCEGAGYCEAQGSIVLLIEAGAPANSLKIDSDGFVGLGTDAPAGALDVNGDAIVRGNLTVTGAIGGGTGALQMCQEKEYMIGMAADGTIICGAKNK